MTMITQHVRPSGSRQTLLIVATLIATFAFAVPAAPAAVTVGHSGWFWGSPQPQGNTLTGLDFAGGRGYASGEFGTLLRTDDGGATWSGIATGITVSLARVRAINADSVVIGGGCALRRSDNGGQSFQRLPWTPSDQSCPSELSSFHFPSQQIGYVLTREGSVLRTDDGGTSFSKRTSVPGTSSAGGGRTPTDIFFISSDVGVAITGNSGDGKVFRTTDGANSWTEVDSRGVALNGLHFVDAQTGYAVGQGTTLLRTEDGGQTWAPRVLDGAPGGLNLTSLDCADLQTCLIAESSGARILRTTDGGATAAAISPSTDRILGVAFAAPTRVVAVGAGGSTVVSDDGGVNFSPVGRRISGSQFGPVTAPHGQIAAAGGANGTLARSLDGGQTWSTVGVPTAARLLTPSFPTGEIGYALDEAGGAFKTTNGGNSWTLLNTGTSSAPNGILAVDPNLVLLVGPKGIRRSTDGGSSFSAVSDKDVSKATLSEVDLISGDDVFAFGPKTVVVSTNGGAAWTKLRLPERKFKVSDADMVGAKSGFVTDPNFRIYQTSNGGGKYRELPAVGTPYASGISFSSVKNGYASSSSIGQLGQLSTVPLGYALRTTDGGQTWAPQLVSREAINVWDGGATGFANTSTGQFFATTTGGQGGTQSTLTVKRVGKGKTKATIAGELNPAEGGESIAVSSRKANGASWKTSLVKAASNGEFTTTIKFKSPTYVVAQWLGDDERAGAGSKALKVAPK